MISRLMEAKLLTHISTAIQDATHRPFEVQSSTPVAGGCINQTWRVEGRNGSRYFIKLNDTQHLAMFVAEAEGLNAITATNTLRTPRPIAHGIADGQSYLVLEYLDLNNSGNAALLGEQLAALHRFTSDRTNINSNNPLAATSPLPCRERAGERVETSSSKISTPILPFPLQGGRNGGTSSLFGFAQDNFIGTTPQPNGWSSDWIAFWRERRLGFQLDLAARNGYGGKLQEMGHRLMEKLPEFFDGYRPLPSLLHGDLWGSNHAYIADGSPVIFDPAPYYGDREADLAMTELFGGFGPEFYAAYRAAWPLNAGYATRKNLYNLYHILNHANLFGGGYARQAEGMMQRLLAEGME